jgi:hypothetical protein
LVLGYLSQASYIVLAKYDRYEDKCIQSLVEEAPWILATRRTGLVKEVNIKSDLMKVECSDVN